MVVLSYILMLLSTVAICGSYFIIFIMGKNNFYENIYLLMHSIKSSGSLSTFWYSVKPCLWLFALLIVLFIILNAFVLHKNKTRIIFYTIILCIGLLTIAKLMNVDTYLINLFSYTDIYEKYYVDTNSVNITFPENKRNIIIIYLESMESSLFSKENGGAFEVSRIPELEKIAKDNINFSNTDKLGGAYTLDNTSCTAFSLVTSTSATPVYTRLFTSYGNNNPYMKKVRSLGNVLRENGYNLGLIQGSSVKFSAIDYYLKDNGDFEIFDDDTARERGYIDKNYSVWWGIEDKKVLEYSKEEILKLSRKKEPFAYILFTIDTHFPDGYLDASCDTPFEEHLSNSYACSSKMINSYIEWIKNQDFYDNTTIFIMGDHKVKQDSYYNKYKDYERVNYNAIINSVVKGNNKNRKFSQFDMYPTILASMGAKIDGDKIGFGINLFSGNKTMIEILGKEKFDNELFKNSDYYNEKIR